MEAGFSSESLVHFYKRARHHMCEVSDIVCQLPGKVISKNVSSHTLKYSHNKKNGCELYEFIFFLY